jgi:amidase
MFESSELDSVTVVELANGLSDGRWTSAGLVETYLGRINHIDGAFGAIRCVVDDCLEQAAASDDTRRTHGRRSLLEGIPVIVKDNIDVGGVATTGGSLALEHSVPERDAPLVRRIRDAGAIVLAKANLSELANFLTEDMPSGYSSIGGQVLNPYDTAMTPSGSSSGSASAVALGLAPLAIGSETDGSITSPCEHQSLVGIKPTLGLVSRTGMLPISPSQDTAGPITKSVHDGALLLAAIAGADTDDPATWGAAEAAAALATLALDPTALVGTRIGVIRDCSEEEDGRDDRQACHNTAIEALRGAGAQLVDVTLPALEHDDEFAVLHYEFEPAVDRYLAAVGPMASRRSLAEIRQWNLDHADVALKFGQTHVDQAVAIDHDAEFSAYRDARARDRDSVEAAFETAMGDRLEALVFPGTEGASWAARAGWPSVVLPAGYRSANRRPVGVLLVSRAWSDARLLSLAFAFERAHPVRRPPWEINPAAFRRFSSG